MRSISFVLLLLSVSTLVFSITVISPPFGDVQNGQTIDLGTIGPGQTISVLMNPLVSTGGIYGIGGQYDVAVVNSVPSGWLSSKSKLYGNPLQVTVTANPDARPGIYNFTIQAINENNGELLGNVTINAKVRVTWDVLNFTVDPSIVTVGPGQPALFNINVTNTASTGDVFQISTIGPKMWSFTKQVYVPAQSTKTVTYEISSDEEEHYTTAIDVVSTSSSNINASQNVTMIVKSDLVGDWKATNHGTVLFPIFENPIYSFAGLISNLFR